MVVFISPWNYRNCARFLIDIRHQEIFVLCDDDVDVRQPDEAGLDKDPCGGRKELGLQEKQKAAIIV